MKSWIQTVGLIASIEGGADRYTVRPEQWDPIQNLQIAIDLLVIDCSSWLCHHHTMFCNLLKENYQTQQFIEEKINELHMDPPTDHVSWTTRTEPPVWHQMSKTVRLRNRSNMSSCEGQIRTGCLTRSTSAKYKVQKWKIYHLSFPKHPKYLKTVQ